MEKEKLETSAEKIVDKLSDSDIAFIYNQPDLIEEEIKKRYMVVFGYLGAQ